MSVNVNHINERLRVHGLNSNGDPVFRVVFSDEQREKRFGVYEEHVGALYLRTERGLREVAKYPYLQHLWILEKWQPPEICFTPEIPETREGAYEVLYAFQTDTGEPLPVLEEFVNIVIHTHLHPELPGHRKSNLAEIERVEFQREVKDNADQLEEQGRSWIGHRLHSGEAIIKP